MALVETNSVAIVTSQMTAAGMSGAGVSQMALAIGSGLTLALRAVSVATADVGTIGVGVGSGVPVLEPNAAISFFGAGLASSGIVGASSTQLSLALGLSLASIVSTATSVTAHPAVGVGAGVMTVIPNGSSSSIIAQSLAASGMSGAYVLNLANAIGVAFELSMPVITGPVAIVGPPSVIPISGVGTGVFL